MTITRQRVTDVFAVPVRNAEVVRVAPSPARTEEPVRECFTTRFVNGSGEPIPDDPVAAQLQELINEKYRHLCVCSPNRSDMLAADAEMKAHPGYAAYKARRDAAMAAHGGCP